MNERHGTAGGRSAVLLVLSCIVLVAAIEAAGQNNFDQYDGPALKVTTRPAANIALGAAYTLEPKPSYGHCTDPGDVTQLTDGVYSKGYFWVQKSTVGWGGAKVVTITVDLGEVKAIRGVSYHTAAGVAGVEWPLGIPILIAGPDKQFYEAGDLVALSADHGLPRPVGYGTHRYWTDKLKTHGRYVKLVVCAQPFAFVDEVEVYAGEPQWVDLPREGQPVDDISVYAEGSATAWGMARRLRTDLHALRSMVKGSKVREDAKHQILSELHSVAESLGNRPSDCGDDFRAVLPVNALHTHLFQAQARLWRAQGHPALTVWQSGLWDELPHLGALPRRGKPAVRVDMMLNEYRAGAFNISNATPNAMSLKLRILDMPGGPNPRYLTVHEVAWTDTNPGQPVAAALPEAKLQDGAYSINVPSGLTRQVWLTCHPTDLEPGRHRGKIELKTGATVLEIPLTLQLYPLRFPGRTTLHFGGWDYTDGDGPSRGVTRANRKALIAHLRAHFVDSPWSSSAVLPYGQYDENGRMTVQPDTSHFDGWLKRWPDAAQYRCFLNVRDRLGRWPMGTAQFDKAVKAWITFWARHARSKGLRPEQLGILLVDEPHHASADARILGWARPIHAAGVGIQVWEDPAHADMSASGREMMAACDVLCPKRTVFLGAGDGYRDYFARQRARGAQLAFYSCSGPARLLDPYAYYRLQAWTCWRYGARASYFWAFGDTGGASSWNEYACTHRAFTPLFLDSDSVTAGKHLEACREGIEDYEYMVMLRKAIADAQARGAAGQLLTRARKLLAEGPARVCDAGMSRSYRWTEPIDRRVADQVRCQVLEALAALGRR